MIGVECRAAHHRKNVLLICVLFNLTVTFLYHSVLICFEVASHKALFGIINMLKKKTKQVITQRKEGEFNKKQLSKT